MFKLTLCLLTLTTLVRAAHKPLSCMSYKFDDNSMLDEYDFEEYSSGYAEPIKDGAVNVNNTHQPGAAAEPRAMRCAADFNFCFTLWTQNANGTRLNISSQGCWKESTDHNVTCVQTECVANNRNDSLLYCCCSGDLCNRNVSVAKPLLLAASNKTTAAAISSAAKQSPPAQSNVMLYIVVSSIIAVLLMSVVAYVTSACMRRREKPEPEAAPLAPSGPGYSSNLRNVDNLKCLDIIGRGKYGIVYKGLIHEQMVAVKNFPEAHKQYYLNEREIYSLPLMESSALLTYFGYDERPTIDGRSQYLLLLSLAPLGCLQDWLIANTMSFDIFCGMVQSITRGLSHLHTELQRGDLYKPCVAHRDLNTRNILVNADLSCCIADFGFALKVFGSKYEYKGEVALAETKSINEVGTIRYMAPELLEGAVNLRDCETSLKQMDVYALGLVLWEVATRCRDFYAAPAQQQLPAYKAPYELEVGTHPSFEQMQVLVARHKARPLFPTGWGGGGAAGKLLKDTCEDCWDHDAEARLTTLCAEERMQELPHLRPRAQQLLNTNDLTEAVDVAASNLTQTQTQQQQLNRNHDAYAQAPASTTISAPPNQQLLPPEKNHLLQPQQQLQPYQGRNPCQERNLAPVVTRTPPVYVEKSKKHSFQSAQEHSLSCLEDDVSVEELLACGSNKQLERNGVLNGGQHCMGQGFPKQHNTERKLRGWHGVRALIQKKLFRRDGAGAGAGAMGGATATEEAASGDADEKCNLVDNRYAAQLHGVNHNMTPSPTKDTTVNFIGDMNSTTITTTIATTATGLSPTANTAPVGSSSRRPNNLNLGSNTAVAAVAQMQRTTEHSKSNLLRQLTPPQSMTPQTLTPSNVMTAAHVVMSPTQQQQQQSSSNRISTPSRIVPRALSTNNNNNNSSNNNTNKNNNSNNNSILRHKPTQSVDLGTTATAARPLNAIVRPLSAEKHFRRQRSLEVFNEVFSGRGRGTDKLRDPSQRVKTPGDVPPSVRKVRASKTLSLYDDRMMDPTTLNIL